MRKVGVADLKAHLSEYLRTVRAGRPLVVMDRETPIAQIVPYESSRDRLVVRGPKPGAPKLRDLRPSGKIPKLSVDPVAMLLEEREQRDRLR